MKRCTEIRFHGRGGQGGVTCAKLVAAMYARLGHSIQAFGDYAGERSGAPVRAYARIGKEPITDRNKVYEPDHLVVLDPTLLGPDVLSGLAAGGTLLVNSPDPPQALAERYPGCRPATVDATAIARSHGIGTRSVVIVNTTIAGAFARLHQIPLAVLEETYGALGFASNLKAARTAYEAVRSLDSPARTSATRPEALAAAPAAPIEVEPIPSHVLGGAPKLPTGSWSTQRPHYVENLAPCNAWCPAGNDVVGFVQSLARGDTALAAATLGRSTPLPGVCGRVCPAPCMEGCNRSEYDGAVQIRALERWVADHAGAPTPVVTPSSNPKRVAIAGGGPAGLGAASELLRLGHRVTIYEGEAQLGGVLRTGIPEYRLPRQVVDREIAAIQALGVEARCGEWLSPTRIAELARQNDALLLATGLQRLRALDDLPGHALPGIEQGIRFLHRVNLEGGVALRGDVVVLGGGNTAIDCARSAMRAGASRVRIVYRRSRAEMPAIPDEIAEAEEEGIELCLLLAPVGFRGSDRVTAVEAAEVELGPPDATGRRTPVASNRRRALRCDHVLLALGQSADLSLLPPGWTLRDGRVMAGGTATNVLACGDLATGDGTVTHAIGSGRRAARLALQMLGLAVESFERPDRGKAVPITDIRLDHFAPQAPAAEPLLPGRSRRLSRTEVRQGLADALEAHRCFSCGHCTHCDTCLVYCPEGIIHRQPPDYAVDYTYCKGCGICVHECPRKGMEMRAR